MGSSMSHTLAVCLGEIVSLQAQGATVSGGRVIGCWVDLYTANPFGSVQVRSM